MSHPVCQSNSIAALEEIILKNFRNEPFHNLHILYGDHFQSVVGGGTCSDKTLLFITDAKKAGFDAKLHSGFIGQQEVHRLARIQIGGRVFFADIGNGWPSIKLFPADQEICYHSYGTRYRTEIRGSRLFIFHKILEKETLQLTIEIIGKPEKQILADIKSRYTSGIVYPFSNSLRFSLIVGHQFLFLRGNRLEIHSEESFDVIEGLEKSNLPSIFFHYFNYDVVGLIKRQL